MTDDASAKLLVDKKFSEIMGNDRRFGNIELLYNTYRESSLKFSNSVSCCPPENGIRGIGM